MKMILCLAFLTSFSLFASDCKKKYTEKTITTSQFLSCASDQDLAFPSWCEKVKKTDVADYLKAASEFTELKGGFQLLAIGMAGEGFSIKQSLYSDKVTSENFTTLASNQVKKYNYSYDSKNKSWVQSNQSEYYEDDLMTKIYFGGSWGDDGSDTFGLEYDCLRKRGLIPLEFTTNTLKNNNTQPIEKMADFVFAPLDNEDAVNENGATRFSRSSTYSITSGKTDCDQDLPGRSSYMSKLTSVAKRPGDPGMTYYKTPEAQAFANAAMWRLAQDRFFAFKKELKIDRDFTDEEIVFWSKAFYNGAQGTQAGAFILMKQYASKGILANDNYLKKYPGTGSPEIYLNARYTLESYKAAPNGCFESYPVKSEKKYTKFSIDNSLSFEEKNIPRSQTVSKQ